MTQKERRDIFSHITDGIRHLRLPKPDIEQAEHDFFEIASHLNYDINEIIVDIEMGVGEVIPR